ncbi:MAG: CAP domain-containing protein [Candidatus Buchananbacteria bacterium]
MFWAKKDGKISKSIILSLIGAFVVLFQLIAGLFIYLHPKRWSRFLRKEKKEIECLSQGKHDSMKFFSNSCQLFSDFLIPHAGNEFKPKALRPKSLIVISSAAILVKIIVTVFLFFTYPTPAELSAIISKNIVSLINQSRVQEGLLPLKENTNLTKYAATKGSDMVKRDYFAHDTPEGKRPWEWIDKNEYDYVYAGENLAIDFTSAETVHEAFLNSPSHRRNILNPKYLEVGIAVLNGQMSGHKTILLVEFFGTQRKDVPSLAAADKTTKKVTQTALAPTSQKKTTASKTTKTTVPVTKVAQPTTATKIISDNSKATKTTTALNPKTAGVSEEEIAVDLIADQPMTGLAGNSQENNGVLVLGEKKSRATLIDMAVEYSNILFVAFLVFLLFSLALNIFIKIRVQHTSIILQSLAVIALLVALILVKFHFFEQIDTNLIIL